MALIGAVAIAGQAFGDYADDFETHTPGATGTDIGWSSAASTTVGASSGIGGSQGFDIAAATVSPFLLLGSDGVDTTGGNFVFRTKLILNTAGLADTIGTRNEIFLHEASTGTNGFLVAKFSSSATTNAISVSTGHTAGGSSSSWGSQGQAAVTGATWQSNVWYQLEFSGTLSDTGDGTASTGTLNMWEVDNPSNSIVTDQEVIGFGSAAGAFNLVDRIQIRSWSVSSTIVDWVFDDMELFSLGAFLTGDANKDGLVSADDLASVQQNFGSTGAADGSLIGDANGDGLVSADDLASVQQNFGASSGAPLSVAAVPEPASFALLGLGCAALLRRRRAAA